MKYLPSVCCFSLILSLVGCGGGGESGNTQIKSTLTTTQNYEVTAIDGYLRNATIWLDLNDNGLQDFDEPSAISGMNGLAILKLESTLNPANFSIIVKATKGITFDESLNQLVQESFVLSAPKGVNIATPLSTLVHLQIKQGLTRNNAEIKVANMLTTSQSSVLSDFIASKNNKLTEIAAGLVRLGIMPETTEQLVKRYTYSNEGVSQIADYVDLQSVVKGDEFVTRSFDGTLLIATVDDIDGDGVTNNLDQFPKNPNESADLDGDGIGNNSDNDIDGDGVLNDSDFVLTLDKSYQGGLKKDAWHYFELKTPADMLLEITLSDLSGDLDLYVKNKANPSQYGYDCRSNNAEVIDENCILRLEGDSTYFIGLYARADSSYNLLASLKEIEVNKVVVLLHGLASTASTWDSLVQDDSFFNGSCAVVTADKALPALPVPNSAGISCFNLEFGAYDRAAGLYSVGLDNKKCSRVGGCSGDYSSFELLGDEVESVVGKIVDELGIDTEITLLGHSRGGLAARAYLQNNASQYKKYVKGMVTTGTPHQGSPLGRFYKYMDDNCTPKSAYRQDNNVCEDSWEMIEMLLGTRIFIIYNYQPKYMMDLLAPTIGSLSPESSAIVAMNNNLFSLESLVIGQLSYEGTKFGFLAKSPNYDLYDYGAWLAGDHPHPSTLTYIQNGASRASLIGDGIVPVYSQQLSRLLALDARNVDVSLNSKASKVLHTEETSRVTDLNAVFEKMYVQLGWNL